MIAEKVKELEHKIATLGDSPEKVDAINQLAFEVRNTNPSRSLSLCKQSQALALRLHYQKGTATSLTHEAFSYLQTADYETAFDKLFEALKMFEELKEETGIAKVHYNFCIIYIRLSDFDNALDSIHKALAFYIKQNNSSELARCYFQMGYLSRMLKDYHSAIDYHQQSIELNKKTGDEGGEAASLMGLGHVYLKTKDYEKSYDCLQQSLTLQQKINDWGGYAASLSAYVALCIEVERYQEAESAISRGIEFVRQLGIKNGECRFLLDLAKISFKQHNIALAEEKAFEALELATKLNLRNIMAPAHQLLSDVYQEKQNFEKALYHYKLYFKVNDEDAKTNTALKAKSIQFVSKIENAQKEAEINRLKNVELKNALEELEEKNAEITASITYALRIQTAILPPQRVIKQHLDQSFVLYKPKDIIAGDFYWMETLGDLVLFAACDCTGHGVPGAMISVVCHNALNRAVREFGLTQPAAILDKTAELVIENFSKGEEEIKDGMDISLCALHTKSNILQWAGANNPLWMIKNGELIETKGDKQSIGMNDHNKAFTNHEFKLEAQDSIYLFTDGFADQFGGDKGKKFTRKRFKDLILSLQNTPLPEQGVFLDSFIQTFRKELMQIDDILVIGVKV